MIWIAPFAILFLAGPAPAAPPVRAQGIVTLPSLFSDADYPAAALRNREQGAVGFRLEIDSEGRPTGCSIVSSSGSASLDSTTCRLLMMRARFRPARDAQGKATADSATGRIVWRIGKYAGPRLQTAQMLWKTCVMGEASKLVPGDLAAAEIARRSFPPCTALEALVAQELKAPMPLDQSRADLAGMIDAELSGARTALQAPAEARTPQD